MQGGSKVNMSNHRNYARLVFWVMYTYTVRVALKNRQGSYGAEGMENTKA